MNPNKTAKKVIILEHVPSEKAGTILDFLSKEKIPTQEVKLYEPGFQFPDLDSVRELVVMGGPMNVYEEDTHPFLKKENEFIKQAIQKNIPFLGVCLGSQLLAKALGAKVFKAKGPEVGWDLVDLSVDAKKGLFADVQSKSLKVLQWHEDTFDLPKGARHLASSRLVPNQAYSVNDRFYGLQFHVEVNRAMLEDWFKSREDLSRILEEYEEYKFELSKITERIYRNFFK